MANKQLENLHNTRDAGKAHGDVRDVEEIESILTHAIQRFTHNKKAAECQEIKLELEKEGAFEQCQKHVDDLINPDHGLSP